ncbi:MAG: hypothetical protein Q8S26_12215 [Azonexus sp.]|nr:hypothetical protein [Azonexus sp.]
MKLFLIMVLLAAAASPPALAADVGVSVSIGQPGFYGRLDYGGYPPPQLIYRQPRMIQHVPVGRPPIYLNVPPSHSRNWGRYCGRYNACDERVYFVRNNWYEREYAPRYQQRNNQRGERRDDQRNDHQGNNGNGNGRGRNH